MTPFERGFSDGERAAFNDRKHGEERMAKPSSPLDPYSEAWWLGYLPQGDAWWRLPAPAPRVSDGVGR